MPNGPIHVATSTPAGTCYAFYKANNQNGLARSIKSVDGAIGGYFGGILPDCIDPPLHAGHRSLGHGLCPVVTGAIAWNQALDGWQNQLRRLANEHAYHRSRSTDFLATAWHPVRNGSSACYLVFWLASGPDT
jgi:hypothetical protein